MASKITGLGAANLVLHEDRAYVVGPGGLSIIDISKLPDARLLGRLVSRGKAVATIVEPEFPSDVPETAQPAPEDSEVDAPKPPAGNVLDDGPLGVAIPRPGLACLISPTGFTTVDVTSPDRPRVVGRQKMRGNPYNMFMGLATEGRYAYAGQGTGGLRVIDIQDPALPRLVTTWYPHQEDSRIRKQACMINTVARDGNELYVSDKLWGIWVLDIQKPDRPRLVGRYPTSGEVRELQVEAGRAYISSFNGGLWIADVSRPSSPVALGQFYDGSYWHQVPLLHRREMAIRSGVWDLSKAPKFTKLGPAPAGLTGHGTILNGRAYTTGSSFRIHDVSKGMRSATLLGELKVPCSDVALSVAHPFDNPDRILALLAVDKVGVVIVDVSVPTAPRELSRIPEIINGHAPQIVVQGGFAYAASFSGGLWIIDIRDPENPEVVSGPICCGGDIEVHGRYAFLSWYDRGVLVLDVNDPAHPVVLELIRGDYNYQFHCDFAEGYLFRGELGALEVWEVPRSIEGPKGRLSIEAKFRGQRQEIRARPVW